MSKRSYTRLEKLHAMEVVRLHEGNVSSASRELNIPRPTLISWLSEQKKQVSNLLTPDENLTLKQSRFADEYVNCGNATKAAERAGYQGNAATLGSVGWENLRKDDIKRRIELRLAAAAMLSAEEVKGTLADQMRVDISDFVNADGYFSLDIAKENGVTHLLKKLEYDEFGGIKKFEIESSQRAAFKLFDHYYPPKQVEGASNQVNIGQLEIIYINNWRKPSKEIQAAIECQPNQ